MLLVTDPCFQTVDILLCLIYDDDGAVDRTVRVVATLDFFVVLSVQFVTPTLFWSRTIVYGWGERHVGVT